MSELAGFETLNEAVYHAAQATREKYGNKDESISVVYEENGRFHFTEPFSEKQDSGKVKGRFKIPKGGLRFVVHNHPDGKENEKFSNDDIENAERLGVPSAIIFGADKTIRMYTPGVTRTSKPKRGANTPRESLGDRFAGMMQ